jgi:hypothetical protein
MAKKINIWERNNIPALEYCSLTRAAELLTCPASDLLHLGQIGAIEFCLSLHRFEAYLPDIGMFHQSEEENDTKFKNSLSEWEADHPPILGEYISRSPLSRFTPKTTFSIRPIDTERFKRFYHHENTPGLKSPIVLLSGLWALSVRFLPFTFFPTLRKNQSVDLTALEISFKEADAVFSFAAYGSDDYVMMPNPVNEHLYPNKLLDEERVKSIATISPHDLFLTRQQIEKVDKHIGTIMPSYVNGMVLRPDDENKIEKPRETIHQFNFMHSLLMIAGITDVELRELSPTEFGKKIAQLAASKGVAITIPDEKTLADWRRKFIS